MGNHGQQWHDTPPFDHSHLSDAPPFDPFQATLQNESSTTPSPQYYNKW
jgi:hypothetical protein